MAVSQVLSLGVLSRRHADGGGGHSPRHAPRRRTGPSRRHRDRVTRYNDLLAQARCERVTLQRCSNEAKNCNLTIEQKMSESRSAQILCIVSSTLVSGAEFARLSTCCESDGYYSSIVAGFNSGTGARPNACIVAGFNSGADWSKAK